MIVNPDVFFLASSPKLIAWNYVEHKQYELSERYWHRLLSYSERTKNDKSFEQIDRDLIQSQLLVEHAPTTHWGWDALSKIFHTGTKNIPYDSNITCEKEWAEAYFSHCRETLSKPSPQENHCLETAQAIALPRAPQLLETQTLQHSLTTRKTCRDFKNTAVTSEQVSEILYFSLGYLNERKDDIEPSMPVELYNRRSSPSGGGLNSAEGYLFVQRVEGIAPGFYYYDPNTHSLRPKKISSTIDLANLLSQQHFASNLPFGIFLTARLDKLWWKYEHSRAYRMALVEVGHIAQSIQLLSTALGLRTWLTGALSESAIEALIDFRSPHEEVFFFRRRWPQ